MPPTHITVTAPEGRLTPIHKSDGVEPGGAALVVAPGDVRRVAYSTTVHRSILRGDLVMCDLDGKAVASADLAAAPLDLHEARAQRVGKAKSS